MRIVLLKIEWFSYQVLLLTGLAPPGSPAHRKQGQSSEAAFRKVQIHGGDFSLKNLSLILCDSLTKEEGESLLFRVQVGLEWTPS